MWVASAGIWKAERTHVAMVLMGGAALLNAGLNWVLVPSLGGLGAAVATAVSYLVWIVASMWVSERLWPVGFEYPLLAAQVVIGAVAVACVVWLGAQSWWSIACVHAAVALLLLSSVNREGRGLLVGRGGLTHG